MKTIPDDLVQFITVVDSAVAFDDETDNRPI